MNSERCTYSDEDDDSLMRRAANGEGVAFGILVQRHQDRVTRVAGRLMNGDSWVAQDIAQEVFLRLWRNASSYRPQGTLDAYLLIMTRHICEDVRRRLRPYAPLEDHSVVSPESGPDAAFSGNAMADAVRLAVTQLPDGQREVFILSHYEGLSYKEIAEILDCPMGTVASRKHLATEALRRGLQAWIDPDNRTK